MRCNTGRFSKDDERGGGGEPVGSHNEDAALHSTTVSPPVSRACCLGGFQRHERDWTSRWLSAAPTPVSIIEKIVSQKDTAISRLIPVVSLALRCWLIAVMSPASDPSLSMIWATGGLHNPRHPGALFIGVSSPPKDTILVHPPKTAKNLYVGCMCHFESNLQIYRTFFAVFGFTRAAFGRLWARRG